MKENRANILRIIMNSLLGFHLIKNSKIIFLGISNLEAMSHNISTKNILSVGLKLSPSKAHPCLLSLSHEVTLILDIFIEPSITYKYNTSPRTQEI